MAVRPLYVPKANQSKPLYTPGKEYMTKEAKEYRGNYHTYKNGQVWSGADYSSDSIELIPFVETISAGPSSTGIYFNLTGKNFDKHVVPEYFYPVPKKKDYEKANFTRYFVCKKNDSSTITEITEDAFQAKNSQNKIGINTILYKFVDLKWSIAGPKQDVERANKLAIAQAANIIPTIKEFLGDLTEYYKE